jgi:hypothetical protein
MHSPRQATIKIAQVVCVGPLVSGLSAQIADPPGPKTINLNSVQSSPVLDVTSGNAFLGAGNGRRRSIQYLFHYRTESSQFCQTHAAGAQLRLAHRSTKRLLLVDEFLTTGSSSACLNKLYSHLGPA